MPGVSARNGGDNMLRVVKESHFMAGTNAYVDGTYLEQNPSWHVGDSAWKADQILRILRRNHVSPDTVYDAGCGAGEILRLLQSNFEPTCELWGADISPQAIELCRTRANDRLHFSLNENWSWETKYFDLVILVDVIAHVEDYRKFLRDLKTQGTYKLLHIPLDISVQHILRENGMIHRRKFHPHLHYFSKTTIMFALIDQGYEIIDWCYTPRSVDIPSHLGEKILKYPRNFFFVLNQEATVRILGGYSL